jgi:hypothetical protein
MGLGERGPQESKKSDMIDSKWPSPLWLTVSLPYTLVLVMVFLHFTKVSQRRIRGALVSCLLALAVKLAFVCTWVLLVLFVFSATENSHFVLWESFGITLLVWSVLSAAILALYYYRSATFLPGSVDEATAAVLT